MTQSDRGEGEAYTASPRPLMLRASSRGSSPIGSDSWFAATGPYCNSTRAAVLALSAPTVDMLDMAIPDCPYWDYLLDDWSAMIANVANEKMEKMHD